MNNKNNINIELLTRGHGATVACLTPDQQVGGSNPSVLRFFFLLDPATKNKTLLESIFYWYYSKDLSNNVRRRSKTHK